MDIAAAMEHGRSIIRHGESITYPSIASSRHVRLVVEALLAEIVRFHADTKAYADVALSEENDPLIDKINVKVTGDCGVEHQSIDEWQHCKICESILQRRLRSLP